MIVIFAGAGASKAVDPEHYPTTVEFFERLPEKIRQDRLFSFAHRFLKEKGGAEAVFDIEQVLWVLYELRSFLNQAGDTRTAPGWFLQKALADLLESGKDAYSPLGRNASRAVTLIENLKGRIDQQVYEFYSALPKVEALTHNWVRLLRPLLQKKQRVEIFTTNYDLVLEQAVITLREEYGLAKIETGHTTGLQPRLNMDFWRRSYGDLTTDDGSGGLLTKLHGSVEWSRGGNEIFISDPYFKGTHDRHVILYPGFKGEPTMEPFFSFHSYFQTAAASADCLIFIGFAFRDQYINMILDRSTQTSSNVIVIDMAQVLPQCAYQKERIQHIAKPFDKESVDSCLTMAGFSPID
jgi:SIR2-like domain